VEIETLKNFFTTFWGIVLEAMPFIVLGALLAGILEELVPQKLVARLMPRNWFLCILIGGLLGLLFPMCECGIIPIMRRLIRKGVPLSACVAYLLAGPIVNVVVMLSTMVAFQGMEGMKNSDNQLTYQMGSFWMTTLRLGLGYLIAVGTSIIVEWQYRIHGNKLLTPLATPPAKRDFANGDDEPTGSRDPALKRVGRISETALHDFVDIMLYLIIGALVASLIRVNPYSSPEEIARLSAGRPYLAIVVMMGLAVVLCLCSEADAFVAASFSTMRPAAKLAFLTLGPMLDLKLYAMYTRVFRPRLIWTIFGAVTIQVFIYANIIHYLWETFAPQLPGFAPGQ
jgi:uncharacterized membrane protein YraQ (UPF0718 family)